MANMFEAGLAEASAMPGWVAALGDRTGGFSPDARYTASTVGSPVEPDEDTSEEDAAREMERSMREAFEAGMAQGQAEARAEAAQELASYERLRNSLIALDETMRRKLADRLAETVAALCEQTMAPLALDKGALQRRCEAAAKVLGDARDRLELHLHPDDIASLDKDFAASWTIVPAPDFERGTVRIEGAEAGAVDGPAQWRAALEAALSC